MLFSPELNCAIASFRSPRAFFRNAGDHIDVHANAVYAALCRARYRNYKSVSASADVDQRDNAVCASLRRGLYINKKAGSLLNGGGYRAERTESFRFLNSISDMIPTMLFRFIELIME